MEIQEYLCKVHRYMKDHPGERTGQAYINVLYKVRQDLAEQIWADGYRDPFYDNRLLPAFFAFIGENW